MGIKSTLHAAVLSRVADMDLCLQLVFIGSFFMVTLPQGLSYMVQNGSSNVHNESAYKMETFELSCTRLPHDRTAGRVKYFLQKDNRVMFIIAKNREDNKFSCSHHVSPKPCSNDSFSMNETCFFQTKKHYPSRCRSIRLFKIFTRALQFNI